MSLPQSLLLKRGETLLASMSACKPSGEMFWLACEFEPTEAFAEIAVLIAEASNVPDTEEGFARSDEIYDAFHENGIRLINPERQTSLEYWIMHIHSDGTVRIRWAEEIPIEGD